MQTDSSGTIAAVRDALARQASNPYRAARAAGLPDNSIRYLLDGRDTKLSRIVEICRALGLELYIGPPRHRAESENEGVDFQISGVAEPAPPPYGANWWQLFESVADGELAELLARLADRWETMNRDDRERFRAAVTGLLDFAGARDAKAIRRNSPNRAYRRY